MHPLQGDEVARFLDAIKGDDFENLYYVTLFTGMRQGEALGLTWDSVFFDQGCLHLHHQLQKERKKGGQYRLVELKNSQDRYVQIPLQVVAVLQRIKDAQLEKQKVLGTKWSNSLGFVFVENYYVIALNAKCNVLGQRRISMGSLSEVSAYPRLVMETALNYNAHSVLLSHNHPGGTCAPSPEDIAATKQLQRLLNGVGILVLDHIIVAGDRTYSMIQHGDIDYRVR